MHNTTAIEFMRYALRLAKKAEGHTLPNPMVGAVVVKNDKVVGKGYHSKAGMPHAEVVAINQAGKKANEATLYVTLEPCAHHGQTPPCCDYIIKHGIKKVYVGMIDKNPLVNGKGIKKLRKHGIKVEVGFFKPELEKLNRIFFKLVTKKLPFITVKAGQSLDGKIATYTSNSKWITSPQSRTYARKERSNFDAIMVGVNTILKDNPKLSASKNPYKIIIDTHLKTPANAKLFSKNAKVIIITSEKSKIKAVKFKNKAEIIFAKTKSKKTDLKPVLRQLLKKGIFNVLCEGGGTLNGYLFDEKLVDRVMFYISPKIIGGSGAIGSVMGRGAKTVSKALTFSEIKTKKIGKDLLVNAYV
jgi:diaminohydroxyphosphoribosylaminopyrimidine deaminase / 5-amino-6-(5-phosphoribosylamino)uracil reductase